MQDVEGEYVRDFEFDGNWREFAVIALSNLVLTVATLGIYRFWATTRVRRYLWSRTLFMGDRLEWAGTGQEMFRSAVTALLVVLVPLAMANLTIRYLINHDYKIAGQVLSLLVLIAFCASTSSPSSARTTEARCSRIRAARRVSSWVE